MAGVKGRSGRRSYKAMEADHRLHETCSNYLLNRFAQLDPDKKLAMAMDMVKKFGITKTDNTNHNETVLSEAEKLAKEVLTYKRNRSNVNELSVN